MKHIFILLALASFVALSQQHHCRVNEVYKKCSGCDQYCNEEPVACKADCSSPGCYCKDDYVRSFKGSVDDCIPRSNCSAPQSQRSSLIQNKGQQLQCGENEVYIECGGCDKYCVAGPTSCAECLPGCYCRDGYLRFNGRCVSRSDCDAVQGQKSSLIRNTGAAPQGQRSSLIQNTGQQQRQCRVNEVYECGCEQYCGEPIINCFRCTYGCYCRYGYKRSFDGGVCIPTSKCVSAQNKDSSWSQNAGAAPQGPNSPLIQYTGQQQQCGVNEVYIECGTCDEYCFAAPASCAVCRPGCYCQEGYVRDGGRCISRYECQQQKQCGANEVYLECGGCDGYCNAGPIACSADCQAGCYCSDGYVREYQGGRCVPRSGCQQQCGVNEVFSQCKRCDQYCNEGPVSCAAVCTPGCSCLDGYKRSSRGGDCIPAYSCEQYYCSVNEVYKDCGGCDQYCNEAVFCTADCRPGCYCQEGYVRSFQGGVCIPLSTCPVPPPADPPVIENSGYLCSDTEVYQQCGVGWQCEDYCGRGANACAYCEPGCYCRPGYIRSGPEYDAVCIPENQCPRAQVEEVSFVEETDYQCGENEVFQRCGVGVDCEDYCGRGANACAYCQPGCYCRPGYVRSGPDYDAVCIPEDQCPRIQDGGSSEIQAAGYQCGSNEVFQQCGVGVDCEDYCGRGANACAYCQPGCYCRQGYVREGPEYDAKCIPEGQCPRAQDVSVGASEAILCGQNEVYDQCGVGKQCEDYCGKGPIACAYCQPGCYCKSGYVREGPESDAKCIPKKKCPRAQDVSVGNSEAYQCGANEIFDNCGVGKQCEDYCGRGANACAYCQPGCYCKRGYIREGPESNAICIPKKKCPRSRASNPALALGPGPRILDAIPPPDQGSQGPGYNCRGDEVFDIGGVGPDCENYCGRGPDACDYQQPACYCKEGLIRAGASNQTRCIPNQKCPVAQKCFDNEEYKTCGTECPPTCDNKSPVCIKNCKAGCFCKEGYIRESEDVQVKRYKCVPKDQCR